MPILASSWTIYIQFEWKYLINIRPKIVIEIAKRKNT